MLAFDTISPSAIKLGEKLFFDKRLSIDQTISCSSCHQPDRAFTDNLKLSVGIKNYHSKRNSSTLLNVAFHKTFMFDERAYKVHVVSLVPLLDSTEMGMSLDNITSIVARDAELQRMSRTAYQRSLDPFVVANSLGAYMRSLISADSKYDQFLKSGDSGTFSQEELAGHRIFFGKGQCNQCHTTPLFTNHEHYNLQIEPIGSTDLGRMHHTMQEKDKYTFKTPTLRNITMTYPYFHNGSIDKLSDAIEYHLSKDRATKQYQPVSLSENEKRQIVAFLKCLTDKKYLASK